jgi:hypothetical protein
MVYTYTHIAHCIQIAIEISQTLDHVYISYIYICTYMYQKVWQIRITKTKCVPLAYICNVETKSFLKGENGKL